MPTLQIDVPSSSAAIRARLNHPIIDSDGHQVEMNPVFLDYLAEVGGASVAKRFKNGVAFDSFLNFEWRDLKPEERRERCAMKPVWKRRIHTTAKGSTPFCAGGHRAVFACAQSATFNISQPSVFSPQGLLGGFAFYARSRIPATPSFLAQSAQQ